MTIDSHCHLAQEDYEIPVHQVISDAVQAGVKTVMGVACEAKDWPELLTLLKVEKSVYGAIGIHPEYANYDYDKDLKKIPDLFKKNPKLLAVGEMGLDYHEAPNTIDNQKDLFFKQIQIVGTIFHNIFNKITHKILSQIHIISQIGKRHFRLNHPKLGGVALCVRVFSTESRTESINIAQSASIHFAV